MLKFESEAFQAFLHFKANVELQLNTKIKALQTIWGGEYRAFTDYLNQARIVHRNSCPHAHEQNGTAERKHRHIVDTGLTVLAQASMPLRYWDEAFRAAVFLINRLPIVVLKGKSPLDTLFHSPP